MDYIFQAVGIGFILSIMVGPVFFVLIETSITKGIKAAIYLDFGVLLSDIFYIIIALFFAYQLKSLDIGTVQNNLILSLIGGGLFIAYGVYNVLKKPQKKEIELLDGEQLENYTGNPNKDKVMLIVKGFMLNFVNPGVIFYWLAILAKGFDLVEEYESNFHIVVFITIILLTYFGIDCFKVLGASKLKPLVTDRLLRGLNLLIGFIFMGTGVFLILRQFIHKM